MEEGHWPIELYTIDHDWLYRPFKHVVSSTSFSLLYVCLLQDFRVLECEKLGVLWRKRRVGSDPERIEKKNIRVVYIKPAHCLSSQIHNLTHTEKIPLFLKYSFFFFWIFYYIRRYIYTTLVCMCIGLPLPLYIYSLILLYTSCDWLNIFLLLFRCCCWLVVFFFLSFSPSRSSCIPRRGRWGVGGGRPSLILAVVSIHIDRLCRSRSTQHYTMTLLASSLSLSLSMNLFRLIFIYMFFLPFYVWSYVYTGMRHNIYLVL